MGHALHRGGRVLGRGRRDIDYLAKGAEGMCVNLLGVLSAQNSTIWLQTYTFLRQYPI
jgi:hypothetical protein